MTSLNAHLLETASESLPGVFRRMMFGCESLFVDGHIYALVWKEGRIGLKLTDPKDYDTLRAMPGATPWSPGGRMIMRSWLLVPESFHDDPATLKDWVRRAHAQIRARAADEAKAPAKRKTTAARTSARVEKKPSKVERSATKKRSGSTRAGR